MYAQAKATLTAAATRHREESKGRAIGWPMAFLLVAGGLIGTQVFVATSQTVTDPGQPGPCSVLTQTVTISNVQTFIYYPGQCSDGTAAPYPAIAFAHGFTLFTDAAAENAGNGRHLASWGYVVAIPKLDTDAETRITQTTNALNYLVASASTSGSFLYQRVDTNRLATVGHSLGGSTALAIAARDARIKAVVALDPVYHSSDMSGNEGPPIWNSQEAANITVPTGILGAPPSSCNAQADYTEIYPLVGATHKASFRLAGVSHCVFADPGNQFCSLVCNGATGADKTRLSRKYMTAWFNYYLHFNPAYYTYLYGSGADADFANGLMDERKVNTAPRGLTAISSGGVVTLTWQLYDHPMVAGYNVYRRLPGQSYPGTPYAHLGPVSLYCDTAVTGGQVYSYTVRSYDSASNLHQVAEEVSMVAQGGGLATSTSTSTATSTPSRTPTATSTSTLTPTCTPKPVFSHWVYLPLVVRP